MASSVHVNELGKSRPQEPLLSGLIPKMPGVNVMRQKRPSGPAMIVFVGSQAKVAAQNPGQSSGPLSGAALRALKAQGKLV
jgi:hypothetical protein